MAQNLIDASWEGDIKGATHLISRGCNPTNAVDWFGRTPLHIACRNGQTEFATRLIEVDGCDPTDTETIDGTTPLHVACTYGHLQMVLLLVDKYGCNPECRDKFGWTPLHKAADCDHAHLDIVLFLVSDQYCDVECCDKMGLTPLQHACGCYGEGDADSSTKERALAVVKFLIERCQCDPDRKDSQGMNALHFSCRAGLANVARYLISKNHCDISSCDNEGNTPLHFACQSGDLETVRFLIVEMKCDLNHENKNKEPPLEFAEETDIIRELIRYGANPDKVYQTYGEVLGKLSRKQPLEPPIKVFVMGDPTVGKSTLVMALRSETAGFLGGITGRIQKVTGVDAKTAGICPYNFESKKYGSVILFDFAGQREFYASHAAVLRNAIKSSPPIFLIVVKLSESIEEMKKTILYWLSFLGNQCTTLINNPHLIVVGSYADLLIPEELKEKAGIIDTIQGEPVFECVDFVGFSLLDCQYPESDGMDGLRQFLKTSCDSLRTTKAINFNCHCFLVYLLDRFRTYPAATLNQIHAQIKGELASPDSREDLVTFVPESLAALYNLCDELNDRGHILFLKDATIPEKSWVVIDRTALLAKVTGTIFAPEGFKQHCQLATSTGVVPLSKIAQQFPKHNRYMLVSFLSNLEFCNEISDPEVLQLITSEQSPSQSERYFFFPALVTIDTPTKVWEKTPDFIHRCGWTLQCPKPQQFLDARFFNVLLLRLAFAHALVAEDHEIDREIPALQRKCKIWKSGMYWGNSDGVETLVGVTQQNKSITILMRSNTLPECLKLRSSIIQKVHTAVKDFCPKVITVESFIDPRETIQYPLKSTTELSLFSITQIARAVVEAKRAVVDKAGAPLSLDNLLSFEPYADLGESILHRLFDKEGPDYCCEVSDRYLSDIADRVPRKKDVFVQLLKPTSLTRLLEKIEQAPAGAPHELIRVFQMWREKHGEEATYQHLRQTLDQFSVFAGRNPLELAKSSNN